MQKEFQNWRYILERLIPIVNKESSRLPYYVDGSVSSSGDGLSVYRPFKTIQEAVNAADFTGSGVVIRGGVIRECGGAGLRSIASEDVAEINYGLQATNVIIDGVQFYLNTGDDIDDDAVATHTYFHQW